MLDAAVGLGSTFAVFVGEAGPCKARSRYVQSNSVTAEARLTGYAGVTVVLPSQMRGQRLEQHHAAETSGSAAIQETSAAGRQGATRSEDVWREAEGFAVPSPLNIYIIARSGPRWTARFAVFAGRSLDTARRSVMLTLFVTCESDAGFGRRRAFISFFCSGHFARPDGSARSHAYGCL